jgi:hypothetical protein
MVLLCRCCHWHNHCPVVACQVRACVLQGASRGEQEVLVWPLQPPAPAVVEVEQLLAEVEVALA